MEFIDIVDYETGEVLRAGLGRGDLFQMFIDTSWTYVSFTRPEYGPPYILVDTVRLTQPLIHCVGESEEEVLFV